MADNKTVVAKEETDSTIAWDELSSKLEHACQKLWAEDKVSAIPVQAIANEIKIGFRHAEQIIASLRQTMQEQAELIRRDYEAQYVNKLAASDMQLKSANGRRSELEEELAKSKAHIQTLLADVAKKEEENAAFQEKYLKIEAQKDSARAKQMEDFIAELEAKDREREAFWKQRHEVMETEVKQRQQSLEKRHSDLVAEMQQRTDEALKLYQQKEAKLAELRKQFMAEFQTREAYLHEQQEHVQKQSEALVTRLNSLEQEYGKKRAELDKLKRDLQEEISELTRHYTGRVEKAKTRNEAAAG